MTLFENPSKPELITYAATMDQVELAVRCGANHLVLEDSKLALRSFSDDFKTPGFQKIRQLADHARSLAKDITLSVTLDIMLHHRHFDTVNTLIEVLKDANIQIIRVQDPGAVSLITPMYPQAKFILNTETGNQNLLSIQAFSKLFTRQTLNMEMPYPILKETVTTIDTSFELQVQGPILLQYSNRRFLAGLMHNQSEESDAPPIERLAEDTQFPGRKFKFYDTPHGHLMFANFDRCLATYIPDLKSLHLAGWIIDARGESDAYYETALRLYRRVLDDTDLDSTAFERPVADIQTLADLSGKPQRGGFFRANKTDQDRTPKQKQPPGNWTLLAEVADVVKDHSITLETIAPLTNGQSVVALTPEAKEIPFCIHHLRTLDQTPVDTSENHRFVSCKWTKNIVPRTRLYQRINRV